MGKDWQEHPSNMKSEPVPLSLHLSPTLRPRAHLLFLEKLALADTSFGTGPSQAQILIGPKAWPKLMDMRTPSSGHS